MDIAYYLEVHSATVDFVIESFDELIESEMQHRSDMYQCSLNKCFRAPFDRQ